MGSFKFWLKVVQNSLVAGLATWVTAILSNGADWFANYKILASLIMAIGVLGASVWHLGAAHHVYARKEEQLPSLGDSAQKWCMGIGGLAMIWSTVLALIYLNSTCQTIIALDAVIIFTYSRFLSRHWITKNVVIAFTCTSPVLLGWSSGSHNHPAVPWGIAIAFFVYLVRETLKDATDRKANHGFRLTLPLWLGVPKARKIAGCFMLPALTCFLLFGLTLVNYSWYVFLPYTCAAFPLLATTHSLWFQADGQERREAKQLMVGSVWLIATFFALAL